MQKNNPFEVVKKYLSQKEYLLLLIASLASIIVLNLMNLAIPKIISNVINTYQQTLTIQNTFYFVLAGLVIISCAGSLLQNYLFSVLGEKIGTDLRNRLVNKILKQDYNYLVKEKPSKLLTTVLSDVNFVRNAFIQAVSFVITGVILIIGSVFMMFSLNAKLAAYIVISVPLFAGILLLLLKSRFKIFKEVQKARDSLNKVINENIKASMLVRVFVAEKTERTKFKEKNKRSRDIGIEVTKVFAIAIPAISVLSYFCSLLIIQVGGQEVIAGRLQVGDISAFSLYVLTFTMPLIALSFMVTVLGQALASLQRIADVLYASNNFTNGNLSLKKIENVKIENLTFKDNGVNLLSNINFNISSGQKIGIIGLNGSGKTLFLKHLIRAVEPTEGKIYINGKDIKDYEVEDIRASVGFCFQENFLVNESIYENIRFGRNVPEKEILQAAKIANVDEFAKRLEKGYKTNAGEKGSNLSGGQKQRIMLARALIGEPSLLVLDDITSRLDSKTESIIFENIKKYYPNMSIIIVSQKISSLKDCDQIYIFDEGKVSESGTHEQLLKSSSLYQEIELTQSNYDE
jgi:ATP-binding cassette subfamily B protein